MDSTRRKQLLSPEGILHLIRASHIEINRFIEESRDAAFTFSWSQAGPDGVCKPYFAVDMLAEHTFQLRLNERFQDMACVLWAENVEPSTNVSSETRLCMLIDMIDGASMHYRGLSNWCSAIVAFSPVEGSLDASYVVIPSSESYYFASNRGVFKKSLRNLHQRDKINVAKVGKRLRDSAIAIHAQRAGDVLKLIRPLNSQKIVDWLSQVDDYDRQQRESRQGRARFRMYNFAGNQMLARLADGTIDVVLDLRGQLPQDFIPGAYLALKAGAVIGNAQGTVIKEHELIASLCHPGERWSNYIVAASLDLYSEVVDLLN